MVIIKNYKVAFTEENFLGKGSFSEVYKANYIGEDNKYLKKGSIVAIKKIKLDSIDTKTLSILQDEISIMDMIKENPNRNIVECYDIIEDGNHLYIILEYCDSGDLKTILKKPMREIYAQFYFSQLANGLKYLDENNIMHRDIKPKNILLTNNRKDLKIADFGFARKMENTDLLDTICGSPLYMAPEIMGNKNYNKQTDLWSIGMILYEILFGFHPFNKCKTIPELKNSMDYDEIEIPPKNTLNKNLSDDCIDLLKSLLQKNVKNRMTWEQFFKHPWINYFKNLEGNKISNLIDDENDSKNSFSSPRVRIIDDYFGESTKNNRKNKGYEYEDEDEEKNKDKEDDDFVFDIEINDNNFKEIIDNSSLLDKINDSSHKYNIIS